MHFNAEAARQVRTVYGLHKAPGASLRELAIATGSQTQCPTVPVPPHRIQFNPYKCVLSESSA